MKTQATVLLIEDDKRLAGMVADYLRDQNLDVVVVHDSASALSTLKQQTFDIALLDLMLPDGNGLDLFRKVRTLPHLHGLPFIMVTARGDPMDKVIGLEIGAEDYIGKPFEPRELLARIRVVLRRQRGEEPAVQDDVLTFGRLEIDQGSRIVRLDGEEKPLTSYQFNLLLAMARHPGRVLKRQALAEMVRPDQSFYDPTFDRSIDVHVARLRLLVEDDPKHPRRILTVRGVGYVFAKAQP